MYSNLNIEQPSKERGKMENEPLPEAFYCRLVIAISTTAAPITSLIRDHTTT